MVPTFEPARPAAAPDSFLPLVAPAAPGFCGLILAIQLPEPQLHIPDQRAYTKEAQIGKIQERANQQ